MASANVIGCNSVSNRRGAPQARGVLDTRAQHETIGNACRLHPERFPIGLGNVEVRHEQAGVDELDRAMREDGLVGFMCHPGLSGHFTRRRAARIPRSRGDAQRTVPITSGRFHAKHRCLREDDSRR